MLLGLLHTTTLVAFSTVSVPFAVRDAAVKVIAFVALAAFVRDLLKPRVVTRPLLLQVAAHAIQSIAFAASWYTLALLCLALSKGLSGDGWTIEGLSERQSAWQFFHGLTLYGCFIALLYALSINRDFAQASTLDRPTLFRYLVHDGEGFRPIDVRRIITIVGAQDYSEVATKDETHLVRLRLGAFEDRLDKAHFIRVHRSAIVNFNELERIEPAGSGRMLVHMSNGAIIQASRSGTRLLRSFAV